MAKTSIEQALEELERKRVNIDHAIGTLRNILAALSRNQTEAVEPLPVPPPCLQDAIAELEQAGGELHIQEIARRVSARRGAEVSRYSLQAILIHHISSQGKAARVQKTRQAHYRLRA